MSTKVIVLGQDNFKPSEKIEFYQLLDSSIDKKKASSAPKEWANIELIAQNYQGGTLDLMFAYNTNRNEGILYIGKFAGGIV